MPGCLFPAKAVTGHRQPVPRAGLGTIRASVILGEVSTMKAAVIDSLERGPRFADFDEPVVAGGETLV